MSQIKSKNTRLEKKMFDMLKDNGIIFSRHSKKLPGKPDIVIKKHKVAIFIDSNFWHGWRLKKWEHKLSSYWLNKIKNNASRDRINNKKLGELGWKVMRIRENELEKDIAKYVEKIKQLSIINLI